jgi:cleavage and polyadenylation specificity factor subunit 5
VSRPKELKKLYLIHLPKEKLLSVPKNMKLLAVPLFELYDNTARYGPQLSAIPHYLSKYRFECVNEAGEVESIMPGGASSEAGGVKVLVDATEGGDQNGAQNGNLDEDMET